MFSKSRRSKKFLAIYVSMAIICTSFLLFLGGWQLQRAEVKASFLQSAVLGSKKPPVAWSDNLAYPHPFQSITVGGTPLDKTLLLDNQHFEHQFGYHVITPFILSDGKVVLVDRGWVRGDPSRRQLPALTAAKLSNTVTGQVYYPSDKTWALGQVFEKKNENLAIIENFDAQSISHFLQKSIYPFIIRLGESEASGFKRDWQSQLVSITPARHKAYALQWFLLAVVCIVFFIGFIRREK